MAFTTNTKLAIGLPLAYRPATSSSALAQTPNFDREYEAFRTQSVRSFSWGNFGTYSSGFNEVMSAPFTNGLIIVDLDDSTTPNGVEVLYDIYNTFPVGSPIASSGSGVGGNVHSGFLTQMSEVPVYSPKKHFMGYFGNISATTLTSFPRFFRLRLKNYNNNASGSVTLRNWWPALVWVPRHTYTLDTSITVENRSKEIVSNSCSIYGTGRVRKVLSLSIEGMSYSDYIGICNMLSNFFPDNYCLVYLNMRGDRTALEAAGSIFGTIVDWSDLGESNLGWKVTLSVAED